MNDTIPSNALWNAVFEHITDNVAELETDGKTPTAAQAIPIRSSTKDYPLIVIAPPVLKKIKALACGKFQEEYVMNLHIVDGVSKANSEVKLSQIQYIETLRYKLIHLLKYSADSYGLKNEYQFFASQIPIEVLDLELLEGEVLAGLNLEISIVTSALFNS